MRTALSTLNNQNGSVIVVAMIILALLTILGISSTNTSTLEVRIATNSQDYQLDFYVADSGWKDGAMWIEEQQDDTRRPVNNAGNIVKNFGWENGHTRINQKSYAGAPPAPFRPAVSVLRAATIRPGWPIADGPRRRATPSVRRSFAF